MAAPLRTLCSTGERHSSRCFTTTCGAQAGIKWTIELPAMTTISTMMDPPPPNRSCSRVQTPRRVVNLSPEVDKGMEVWREKREEAKRIEERNKSLLLKPKGNLLLKKNK
uniref:39S ribosomal protein L52, mitochondrial n=1 Tax=Oncorhynchus kisutch TaxID=8019 RepID=A0A8C7G3V9_ONCKI